jgi:hypothetical protein
MALHLLDKWPRLDLVLSVVGTARAIRRPRSLRVLVRIVADVDMVD